MNKITDYKVVYYYSFDDECYLAVIPDLPGCISDGNTIAEAIKNVRDFAKDWIEITSERGEDIPEPSFIGYLESNNISIFDVAYYILDKTGMIASRTLQKWLYYCKAWSCGWFGKALFPENFEAWAGGPVNRALYEKHEHVKMVDQSLTKDISCNDLTDEQKSFVDMILKVYEDFDPDILSEMTHQEDPWKIARGELLPGEKGTTVISEPSLQKYYGQANVA